ncbi:hypothetical protein [Labrenzia sp. VG12]|uniref:hypothetical protein n=1 Tax=Labrenzia sp. VG12 TaxID=2021862 RepID=UPI000B8C6991|nr:hypothetical protein [Labrenzia sp. VG12]ASP34409.1 hypothetical protein CHH27_15100 [Labrenzia sp. VG12]
MSDTPQKPAWQTILVALIATAIFVTAAYYVWIYANIGVRTFDLTKGTLFTDLRFFIGLLAVFLVLSVLDRIIEFVKSKSGGGH